MNKGLISVIFFIALAILLSSCTTTPELAETYVTQEQWLKAVLEYRKQYANNPNDVELKSRLKQIELKAADHFYQLGLAKFDQGNLRGAIAKYKQGLVAKPDHAKLVQAITDTIARKEANAIFTEAETVMRAGRVDDAIELYKKVIEIYPDHKPSLNALTKYKNQHEQSLSDKLALTSKDPISINFKDIGIKTVFDFLAKSFGINIIFDSDVNDNNVTLFADEVTFEQALHLMLATTKTYYKKLGRNTILIYPDTSEKRGQYEDYHIRTFYLKSADAKNIANLLKAVLSLKKVVVNEQMNAIVIREKPSKLLLVENLITANDRKPAEMILDVEILEVNRTKTERLGFNYGSKISVAFDTFEVSGSWSDALKAGVVTLPAFTFDYFKQDVDAKILANPKIRVIDTKTAKIHIGDRVPLRSSTILDATGQTRTTFEYRDIGIRLTVLPEIHLDNSVTVKLGLEVSTLGQNLGTADEPAFSIGTRNSETFMLLRDGETAILGGLIRDEDRGTNFKVPGLGEIPIVGNLFNVNDNEKIRTDVLLTITPRVVRAWELPSQEKRNIYSGTKKNVTSETMYQFMDETDTSKLPKISMEIPAKDSSIEQNNTQETTQLAKPDNVILEFSKSSYAIESNEEIKIELVGKDIPVMDEMFIELLFNSQLLEYIKSESGDLPLSSFNAKFDEDKGTIILKLKGIESTGSAGKVTLGNVTLKGIKAGTSHMIYRVGTLKDTNGNTYTPIVNGSQIIVN